MRKLFVLLLAAALLISGCAAQAKPADVIAETQKAVCLLCAVRDGQEVGRGSAFVVGNVLLTAAHCVADFDSVRVRWGDKELTIPTADFLVDKWSDVAAVKVTWQGGLALAEKPATYGHKVYAVGHPEAVVGTPSSSSGTVTGEHATSGLSSEGGVTDADGYPGMSGGAVVNGRGEVVGVIQTGDGEACGYAYLPTIAAIVERLTK